MRTESGGRETGRDGEHERVRQIKIQKERERQALRREGGGGASAYRGSLWSSSSSSSKNRGEKKQRWLERLNSCWNGKGRDGGR